MNIDLATYTLQDPDRIVTPALLIYPKLVDANIQATLRMTGGDPGRWRPHVKTAKLAATIGRLLAHGVSHLKCATTLELLTACRCGASDVLVAFAVVGANAQRVLEIAAQFPGVRISVLIENLEQALAWRGAAAGLFIDLDPGMHRTGISEDRVADIVALAGEIGPQFRGLHYYDGHASGFPANDREGLVHQGYSRLLRLVRALGEAGSPPAEVITSGTPAAPFAMSYQGFGNASFVHRISAGTVVYNDTTSLGQLPDQGYAPAAVVLSTVVSRPTARSITCDAGHKAVSVDAGVPNCFVIGHPALKPLKPSEEHLPIEATGEAALPQIGDKLYLVPRHVCPTVNNFDQALMIVDGRVIGLEQVTARGHESPIAAVPEHAYVPF
ncbi:MAG: alanine racemase [Acidobacteriaceae bacterium]|nr:alanine racemase [Acidobacteriaceae bacterium]